MNPVSAAATTLKKRDILLLYKKLMRYSNSLKYTDKDYYFMRVRGEFWRNRELTDPQEINFQFQLKGDLFKYSGTISCGECVRSFLSTSSVANVVQLLNSNASQRNQFLNNLATPSAFVNLDSRRFKHSKIDTSMVPELCEDDLEEWFIKGSGPGGSNVNKRTNCCSLRHKPSGIIIKCHLSRELNENRKLARKMMIEKLDEYYNGENSVKAQKERLELRKMQSMEQKSKKSLGLKKKYKDLLQQTDNNVEEKCTDIITESSKIAS